MIHVHCYQVRKWTFKGRISERFIKLFLDCYDKTDNRADFFEENYKIADVPVYKRAGTIGLEYLKNDEQLKKVVCGYNPEAILVTASEQFADIIRASDPKEINTPGIMITGERTLIQYAQISNSMLLVAYDG